MRILHVITSLQIGGAEKLMVDILPIMKQRGIDAEIAVFKGTRTAFYNTLESEGVKIHLLSDNGSVYNPMLILKLAKLMSSYDIVHTHNSSPQLFAAIANIICRVYLVTTEHNTYNRKRDSMIMKLTDRFMYHRYKKVICISDLTQKNLVQYLPFTASKACVVNNGINVNVYQKAPTSSEAVLRRGKGNIILTMVGAFRQQKDQDTIVRALCKLPYNVKLWLIGDGERRTQVEKLVASLNLKERVYFWGRRNDIQSLLKSSDLFVMSSHWEGFGLAAAEGMAAGLPVLASDVDGLSQVVGGAGILFAPGDDNELASRVKELIDSEDLRNVIIKKQIERVKAFDINRMVDEYCDIYHKMMNNGK